MTVARWGGTPRGSFSKLAAVVSATLGILLCAQPSIASGNGVHGKELFALAAGCNCHTPADGPVGVGGGEVVTPFGTFYGPNITPDVKTGIGGWTDAEVGAAIRDGSVRGKGAESPAMPYYLYAGMSDADLDDLIAYLRTLPAVSRDNHPHVGEVPLARWAYWSWRILFVQPRRSPARAPAAGVARGRYLVEHVALCVDCHTPRGRLGTPNWSMYLGGVAHGPGGDPVPNITPDRTGIAGWDEGDVIDVLTSGMLPNFDNVQGAMEEAVDGRGGGPGYKDAPEADWRAVAEYLKTVSPIDNAIHPK